LKRALRRLLRVDVSGGGDFSFGGSIVALHTGEAS